jgi:hypothetical protein
MIMPAPTFWPTPGRSTPQPLRSGVAAPPAYRPKSFAVAPALAPRAVQPKRPVSTAPPPVYRPHQPAVPPTVMAAMRLGQQARSLPFNRGAHFIQRAVAGGGAAPVVAPTCPECGGNMVPYVDPNGDTVNGHLATCSRYVRSFQTVIDRTLGLGLQRSHSYRALREISPAVMGYDNGLYRELVPATRVWWRAHQHDNNITGPGPVSNWR